MKSTRQDVKEDRSDLQRAQEQRALQSSCTEGDSFAITSSVFPLTEGCFSDLGRTTGDGKIVYESALFLVASLSAFTTTSSETLVRTLMIYVQNKIEIKLCRWCRLVLLNINTINNPLLCEIVV